MRSATVLVCDEVLVSLNGKFTLIGTYTADIAISSQEITVPQLAFIFIVEGDMDDPFRSLSLEVKLPGERPLRTEVPLAPLPTNADRTRWVLKWPVLIPQPVLRPGRIEAKVIHEKGEISASATWITLVAPAPSPAISAES